MLELSKQKHVAPASWRPQEKQGRLEAGATKPAPSELEQGIAATDAEIDNVVYELYGITEEERKIIKGS